ncbi:DUF1236 domain-containing protein [Tardiphaga sp. P9-11]|uniref:DUF1236 domain-containing protein n=1 Tax=Tardiphaga sp. P9-11 TaxID=2024614 RepID=UPI0011F0B34A|nr:DUF1236 domain-containing protein [Tardiphaga sp. P9-11]KAA0073708.1 DUF1236 domain-containing protein [Tardiphaga sp. P9-11]
MKARFLFSTAVGLVLATAAVAQSPSATATSPSTQQTQSPSTSSPTTQKAPDTTNDRSTSTSPSSSTSTSQAQTTAPSSAAGSSTSQPPQAQTKTPPATAGGQMQAPTSGGANAAAQPTTTNNTAQSPSNNAAQAPSTNNNAQSQSTSLNASVNIDDQQRTRVTQSISRLNVQPLNNVNFSLTVGTSVPRDIRLQTLPSEVVEVVPQYRGYSFFVVRDEIVIVEPSTLQIVTVLPRSGGSTAAAPAPARSKVSFTDKDRDVVRKHVRTRITERQTTGSTAKTVIRRGEHLPETVEIEEFPDVVYREAPSLRDYRYIHRENRTYLIDPGERVVIDEID